MSRGTVQAATAAASRRGDGAGARRRTAGRSSAGPPLLADSRRRRPPALLLALGVFVLVSLLAGCSGSTVAPTSARTITLTCDNGSTIDVQLAANEADRQRGLAGRTHLAPDEGMLFVFDRPLRPDFWMKGCLVPLDIVWLNDDGTLMGAEETVTPDTYPRLFEPKFCLRYVLEVPAGFVAAHHLRSVRGLPDKKI